MVGEGEIISEALQVQLRGRARTLPSLAEQGYRIGKL
jgi:hypothetical protein